MATLFDNGFVLLHRSLLGHPAFRNDAEAMAFAWMIARASWTDIRVRYKGHPVTLKRGQLCVSVRDMAAALDRPKGWVERLFIRLKNETMVETCSGTGGGTAPTVITICNYDKYQPSQDSGRTATGQRARRRPDSDRTQNNEGNEDKNKERDSNESPTKGGRLPKGWRPGPLPESVAKLVAQWPPGRIDMEGESFTDYWTAKTGKDATKADWDKTWHNWIRRAHDSAVRSNGNGNYRNSGNGRDRPVNGFRAALDEAIAATDPDRDEFGGSLFPDGVG